VTCQVLIAYPDEVTAEVRRMAGQEPTGASLAQAIGEFLGESQPWLAERIVVRPGKGCAAIVPRSPEPEARPGEKPMDVLRAVESALGMFNKLPEIEDVEDAPEIEVDPKQFGLAGPVESEREQFYGLLHSKVRYFPLPGAEWFEVCEGELFLTSRGVTFVPRYIVGQDEDERTARGHEIPLAEITQTGRDTWVHLPCLRVETKRKAFRYGWPPCREDIWSNFDVEEWLSGLRAALDRRGRE